MATQIPTDPVSFTTNAAQSAVAMRTNILAQRRLVDAVDLIELEMLVRILTRVNSKSEVDIATIWLAVLRRHGQAEIADALIDADDKTYSSYRQETLAVYGRLQVTAAGEGVVEDELAMYPSDEHEETANKRRLDTLLRWAAEQVNAIYSNAGYLEGKDLLKLLEFDARYAIEMHHAYQWFDDIYALGYAIETKPGFGSNAFGGARAQVAFVQTVAETINEAVKVCDDASQAQEDRDHYSQRVVVLWPLLKGVVYAVIDNSNSQLVKIDDELLSAICRALSDGKRIGDTADRLDMNTHWYSEDGTAARSTPTAMIIEKFRERVNKERAEQAQFAALIR